MSIEEPKQTFLTLAEAVSALEQMLSRGAAVFGQVLAGDGFVLANKAVLPSEIEA